jgi:hypothetical protein
VLACFPDMKRSESERAKKRSGWQTIIFSLFIQTEGTKISPG